MSVYCMQTACSVFTAMLWIVNYIPFFSLTWWLGGGNICHCWLSKSPAITLDKEKEVSVTIMKWKTFQVIKIPGMQHFLDSSILALGWWQKAQPSLSSSQQRLNLKWSNEMAKRQINYAGMQALVCKWRDVMLQMRRMGSCKSHNGEKSFLKYVFPFCCFFWLSVSSCCFRSLSSPPHRVHFPCLRMKYFCRTLRLWGCLGHMKVFGRPNPTSIHLCWHVCIFCFMYFRCQKPKKPKPHWQDLTVLSDRSDMDLWGLKSHYFI